MWIFFFTKRYEKPRPLDRTLAAVTQRIKICVKSYMSHAAKLQIDFLAVKQKLRCKILLDWSVVGWPVSKKCFCFWNFLVKKLFLTFFFQVLYSILCECYGLLDEIQIQNSLQGFFNECYSAHGWWFLSVIPS